MSPELVIFFSSMLPITELRLTIPVAIAVYNMPVWSAFVLAVLGNIIVGAVVLFFLDLLINKFLVHKIYFLNRFFAWLFERTRKKHSKRVETWGDLALLLFVAIPLPGTGAWTGALIAFVFGIPFKRAFPLISLGVIIAGILVTLITKGIINLPII